MCIRDRVNTDCPVCKTNMSECTGTAPVTPEPDKDAETDAPAPKPEKKSNVGMIPVSYTHLNNIHSALFSVAAYTVILCFSLFKTGSLAKSIFHAH